MPKKKLDKQSKASRSDKRSSGAIEVQVREGNQVMTLMLMQMIVSVIQILQWSLKMRMEN